MINNHPLIDEKKTLTNGTIRATGKYCDIGNFILFLITEQIQISIYRIGSFIPYRI